MDGPEVQEGSCHCEVGGCPCELHGGRRAARTGAMSKQSHRVEHGEQLECGCLPEPGDGAGGGGSACSCSRGHCPCQDPSEHAEDAPPPPRFGIADFSVFGHGARPSSGRSPGDAEAQHAAPDPAPPGSDVRAVGAPVDPCGHASPSPEPDACAPLGAGAGTAHAHVAHSSASWRKARSLDEALSQATPEEAAAIVASNTDSLPRLRTAAEEAEEKRQRHKAAERLRARVKAAAEAALSQRSWVEEVHSTPAGLAVPDSAPRPAAEDVAAAAREAMRRQSEYTEWQNGVTAALAVATTPAASPRGPAPAYAEAGHAPGSPLPPLPASSIVAAALAGLPVQLPERGAHEGAVVADRAHGPTTYAQGVQALAREGLPEEPGGSPIPSPPHAPVAGGPSSAAFGRQTSLPRMPISPTPIGHPASPPVMLISLPAPLLSLIPSTNSLLSLSDGSASAHGHRRVGRPPSPRAAPPPLRHFTPEEVSRHSTRGDCWLIAHGNVYDVTAFLDSHPAGPASILRHAGTDATRDFDFHSRGAQKLWAKFQVGYLHGKGPGCIIG